VGLERCPLSLVSIIEELLERKSSGSCLENWVYGCMNPSRWPHGTPYPQNLALASSISRGCSVGIVRSRSQATEISRNWPLANKRPTTSQKIWKCRKSKPDPWICSQDLWPLDHRGGLLSFT
jgi:hypothetical protein